MKYLALLGLVFAFCGCHRNEFDVTPDQITKRITAQGGRGKGMPDLNHLPPGAVKHEYNFKKGDRLPDGTIAEGNRKMVTVEMTQGPGGPDMPKGGKIVTSDTRISGGN